MDQLRDLLVKAETSGLTTGAQKKNFVMVKMDALGIPFDILSSTIDLIILLLKDEYVREVFSKDIPNCLFQKILPFR